ncbi:Cof-type HAD-IIB family hydrolase [Lentibacillus sp. L22]|uniref:Cof-type HAD-IIB family hydrolase n=1 Tax=Lentibacillus TaxID=175304 RepID=UPI0022B11338|nr:Cof-type HAD-IIB family hydrolase [Lentibacillus daqui]
MRLIASDLDGTLLNDIGEISRENLKAIKKAGERGIKFVAATGRSFNAASKPLQASGISCPIICLNGANTYDLNKNLIRTITMDLSTCREIISVCQTSVMYIEFFTNFGVFSNGRHRFMEVIINIMKTANPDITEEEIQQYVEQRFQDEQVQFIQNYEEILSNENMKVYKILGFSLQDKVLRNTIKSLENKSGLAITSSGPMNLEFNHKDAQKGTALKDFANSLGIQMKDVMALGDNLNDRSMLEQAGHGVAMGNAVGEIKEGCKYTTKTNNENGVAYAIEAMLKKYNLQI